MGKSILSLCIGWCILGAPYSYANDPWADFEFACEGQAYENQIQKVLVRGNINGAELYLDQVFEKHLKYWGYSVSNSPRRLILSYVDPSISDNYVAKLYIPESAGQYQWEKVSADMTKIINFFAGHRTFAKDMRCEVAHRP